MTADNKPTGPGINPKELLGLKKLPLRLVSPMAILGSVPAMALGGLVKGYGPFNFRQSRILYSVYLEAILRHLLLDMDGDEVDEESLFTHIGSIKACCDIILDAKMCGTLVDDRYKTGRVKAAMAQLLEIVQAQPANWQRLQEQNARRLAELDAAANRLKQRAWDLYCEDTAGSLDVRDSWDDLPAHIQARYLEAAGAEGRCTDPEHSVFHDKQLRCPTCLVSP